MYSAAFSPLIAVRIIGIDHDRGVKRLSRALEISFLQVLLSFFEIDLEALLVIRLRFAFRIGDLFFLEQLRKLIQKLARLFVKRKCLVNLSSNAPPLRRSDRPGPP